METPVRTPMSPPWEEDLDRERVYKATSALCQHVQEQKEKSQNILEDDAEWIFLVIPDVSPLGLTVSVSVCALQVDSGHLPKVPRSTVLSSNCH